MPLMLSKDSFSHYIKDHKFNDHEIFIVPSIFQENTLEEIFLSSSLNKCIQGGKVLRFEDFIFRYISSIDISPFVISTPVKQEIIRNSLIAAKKRNELLFFKNIFSKEGLIDDFFEAITSLKEASIRPLDFEMIIETEKNNYYREKAHDIFKVFSYYNDFLKNNNLLDKEDYYDILLSDIDSRQSFPLDCKRLTFTGFNSLTGQEIDIIKKISEKLEINFHYKGSPPYLKYFIINDNRGGTNSFSYNERYKAIGTFGRLEEVKEIAYYIIETSKELSLNFSDYTVLLRNKEKYFPLIKRVFESFKLPYTGALNTSLNKFPFSSKLYDILRKSVKKTIEKDSVEFTKIFKEDLETENITGYIQNKLSSHNLYDALVYTKFLEATQETEKTLTTLNLFVSYKYFFEIFNNVISKSSIEKKIHHENGVRIIDYRYSESVDSKHIIIPELIDSVFPKKIKQTCVLDSNIIFHLKTVHGYKIQDENEFDALERNLFHSVINKNEKFFLFTFHKTNMENASIISSPFIKNISSIEQKTFFDSNLINETKLKPQSLTDKQALNVKIIPNKFSPSSLNLYSACPYKYFVSKILKLEKFLKDEIDLNPIDKGNILHKTIEIFYKNENGYNVILKSKEDGKKLILSIFEIVFLKVLPQASKYQLILKNHLIRKLLIFIDEEHSYWTENPTLIPTMFEENIFAKIVFNRNDFLKFEIIPHKTNIKESEIYINAFIDRIDIDEKNKIFSILDYKLKNSSLKGIKDIVDEKNFQLPIYISLFKSKEKFKDYDPAHAYFYKLFNLDKSEGIFVCENYKKSTAEGSLLKNANKNNVVTEEEFKNIISNSLTDIMDIINLIRSLDFPISPKEKACEFCDFGEICQIKK